MNFLSECSEENVFYDTFQHVGKVCSDILNVQYADFFWGKNKKRGALHKRRTPLSCSI